MLLVLLHHLAGTRGFPLSYQDLRWIDLGNLGVRIFFVLSGFLITGLLLREQRDHGRISLGHFYFRRALRIFPAYYVFLAFLLLVNGWLVTLKPGDMLYAATFTDNYNACCHGPFVAHTWSLGVEEQFYLLWPAILLLAGATGGFRLAALFVLIAPVIRLAFWYLMPEERWGIGTRFETVGDALAVGCLLAGLRDRLFATPVYRRLLESPAMLMVPLGVLALATLDRPRIQAAVGVTLMNLGIAVMIDWCVRNPAGAVGRMLNWRPVVAIGVASYSLYLWQSPFLNRFAGTAASAFPINLVLLGFAAAASYALVERPALALRQRLERRWMARPARAGVDGALSPAVPPPSVENA